MDDRDRRRLLAKVARLYHHSGLRQTEIAERLRISQTRVSRLLQQAESRGHRADGGGAPRGPQRRDRGGARSPVLAGGGPRHRGRLRRRGRAGRRARRGGGRDLRDDAGGHAGGRAHLVEPHAPPHDRRAAPGAHRHRHGGGDAGRSRAARPAARSGPLHAAPRPAHRRGAGLPENARGRLLPRRCGGAARPRHVRAPGPAACWTDSTSPWWGSAPARSCRRCSRATTSSPKTISGWRPNWARSGSSACVSSTPRARRWRPRSTTSSPGVTLEQLRAAKRRWVVAGGPSKYPALRAVLLGGWADTLVTDAATARWLLAAPPPTTPAGAGRRH